MTSRKRYSHSDCGASASRFLVLMIISCFSVSLYGAYSAPDCGGVNYSLTSSALHDAATYILTIMQYVVYIIYSIASLFSLYSATVIYIKLNTGEEGLLKPILVLFGSILFLFASTMVIPAFFGVNHATNTSYSFWH